jgi:hypothetical protein
MKLRALALGAVLVAAAVPTNPASAAWRHHGGWGWNSTSLYYPPTALYYAPPYDNFGPVGHFVGYEAGYTDGHWHPAYWRYGHSSHPYVAYWD